MFKTFSCPKDSSLRICLDRVDANTASVTGQKMKVCPVCALQDNSHQGEDGGGQSDEDEDGGFFG